MLIHPILFPATYAGFALAEQLFPAVPLLRVKRWRVKGLIFFALGGVLPDGHGGAGQDAHDGNAHEERRHRVAARVAPTACDRSSRPGPRPVLTP